jgi:predicted TIM-barrel fold metal-dependent hydrolase
MTTTTTPEHNVTGVDFQDRRHFRYTGPPLFDVHAHVMRTRPPEGREAEAHPADGFDQARTLLAVAEEFGVGRVWSMGPPEDVGPLRERFGRRLGFNGPVSKKPDEPDEAAYRLLDRFLEAGVDMIKFWAAPRGRERGLFVDAPWRVEAARRARAAGVRVVMVHVADPDTWFRTVYTDPAKYGTKDSQYGGLRRLLEMFPDLTWVGAHMGGDPEHPDHLEALLERYPNLHFDTSATKWQVREVSARRDAVRALLCRHPDRFLFGSDLVTRHGLPREHYASRYWCHRTLWESTWEGRSPIADPDYTPEPGGPPTPPLCGLALPPDVLDQVYRRNALRLLGAAE